LTKQLPTINENTTFNHSVITTKVGSKRKATKANVGKEINEVQHLVLVGNVDN
jgi:hypothetical protein